MTITYANVPYCALKAVILRCAPANESVRTRTFARLFRRIPDVHLLSCDRPQGPLESAPRTSLREDSAHEHWEGFWNLADEGYYTRCTRSDGSQQWFQVIDEASGRDVESARVLRFRRHNSNNPSDGRMRLLSRDGQR